ncbi:MAG: YdcF family protein [Clostridia bacterium]|nr:YdcF family protein [Clostridia bacterium]
MRKQRFLPLDFKNLIPKKHIPYIISIFSLLILAAFFFFVPAGYSFLALVLLCISVVIGLYWILSIKPNKTKRLLKTILTCFMCLICVLFIVAEIPVISTCFKREKASSPYCIVLGAAVHGSRPSRVLNERISAAEEFLKTNPDSVAVLSGGQGPGEDIAEAECMKNILIERGIAESRLLVENKSTTTKENIAFSKKIIQSLSPDETNVTIISSETHLYRACIIAKEAGLNPSPFAAKTRTTVIIPQLLRESVAVWLEWIF